MNNTGPHTLILASGSPRRRDLLRLFNLAFVTTSTDIDETPLPGESAADYTLRLSQEKARAACESAACDGLVLAADTTVADGDTILGKPADADDARAMLRQLRGRAHQVYTAITLADTATGRSVTEICATDVPMRHYSDAEIETYITSGDPFDKAGSYAIQNPDFRPVVSLSGCYANVMGLPLCHLVRALRVFGIEPSADIPQACQRETGYACGAFGAILGEGG